MVVFNNIVPSNLGTLSLQQALELTNVYLENAYRMKDQRVALVLCHDAEVALSQAKKASKKYPVHPDDTAYQILCKDVAMAYIDLGQYLKGQGYPSEAAALCKKAEKWGGNANDPGRLTLLSRPTSIVLPSDIALHPNEIDYKLPQPDERLNSTPQLVCCLSLIQASHSPDDILEPAAHAWLQVIEKDADEQERLYALSTEVIRAFMKDELKDAKAVAEVVCLTPVLTKDSFNDLLREFHTRIDHSGLLNFQLLEGIAQLIQGADSGYLSSDDLVKILELFSARLMDTHQQSPDHLRQLTLAVSHVLDAMADAKITGLDREKLHEPLSKYLGGLKGSKDPFLVYQAAYAYQALLCVPDNETTWQAAMRRTGKVVKGVSGLVSAVKGLDLEKFFDGLTDIQQGLGGVSKVIDVVKTGYEGVMSLANSGHGFVECLKEGLSFEHRREWYAALRGADTDPRWRTFLIQEAWEIYRDDVMWGDQANVKQWILNILMQLASTHASGSSGVAAQLHSIAAVSLLQDLEVCENSKKLDLYRQCRTHGPISYPLKISLPELGSPSLLDRVQNRPDVEGNIRVLRKQRTKERGTSVYIPPQAKPTNQAPDDTRFPLMEKVKEFLDSERKVFLLLGDSGAGKSTFTRELE
ncbi:hypothetical protein BGX31_010316, partial [Mortierella sp. GBA43]